MFLNIIISNYFSTMTFVFIVIRHLLRFFLIVVLRIHLCGAVVLVYLMILRYDYNSSILTKSVQLVQVYNYESLIIRIQLK